MADTTTTVELPESLVETTAIGLADEHNYGYIFRGRYPQLEATREGYRQRARAALGSLLSDCEVREERRCVWPDGSASVWGWGPLPDPGWKAKNVDGELVTWKEPGWVIERRLVITTSAEAVESQ